MSDPLKLTPAEEIIRDLTKRIETMRLEMVESIEREEARSREWVNDRLRRFDDETCHMRQQRDAMLKAWSDSQPNPILLAPPHER